MHKLEDKFSTETRQYNNTMMLSQAEFDQSITMLVRDKDSLKHQLAILEREKHNLVLERTTMIEKHVSRLYLLLNEAAEQTGCGEVLSEGVSV